MAAFVYHAKASYPGVPLDVRCAEGLGVDDASAGGILAWYSLIHTELAGVASMLGGFARALVPNGSLVVGFFNGPALASFEDAVTTAYFWPSHSLARLIQEAGFIVNSRHTRTDPGARGHGETTARRK